MRGGMIHGLDRPCTTLPAPPAQALAGHLSRRYGQPALSGHLTEPAAKAAKRRLDRGQHNEPDPDISTEVTQQQKVLTLGDLSRDVGVGLVMLPAVQASLRGLGGRLCEMPAERWLPVSSR